MPTRRGEFLVSTSAADRGDAGLASQLRDADAATRAKLADERTATEIHDACAVLLGWNRELGRMILQIGIDTRLRCVAQLARKTMRGFTREYQSRDVSLAEQVLNDPEIHWRNTRRSRVPPKKPASTES
jgi:hypothetical protein